MRKWTWPWKEDFFYKRKKTYKRLYSDCRAIKSTFDAKNKSSGQSNTRGQKLFAEDIDCIFKCNSERI